MLNIKHRVTIDVERFHPIGLGLVTTVSTECNISLWTPGCLKDTPTPQNHFRVECSHSLDDAAEDLLWKHTEKETFFEREIGKGKASM